MKKPLLTLLFSLHANHKPAEVRASIMTQDMASQERDELLRLAQQCCPNIVVRVFDFLPTQGFEHALLRYTSTATMLRLHIPDAFPDLDRVIYLDADIVV